MFFWLFGAILQKKMFLSKLLKEKSNKKTKPALSFCERKSIHQ